MKRLALKEYVDGVLAGDVTVLARAITLVESTAASDRAIASAMLAVLPRPETARRIGITGVPGAGKSTLLDALGMLLVDRGHRVALLAVDPSSVKTGGSILGDKTRMTRLAASDRAFIRPSPTGGALGGVTRSTREAMRLCEVAGYDVVIVETVGVGQSEVAVADMVDVFVALMLAGAGDELQGIKKGVLELVDVLVVNKADGDNEEPSKRFAHELGQALRIVRPHDAPTVLTTSGREERGLDALFSAIDARIDAMRASGDLEAKRAEQRVSWMWSTLETSVLALVTEDPRVSVLLPEVETQVRKGELGVTAAVDRLLGAWRAPT